MDYKQKFVELWNDLQQTPMFADMANTVEASSWHREANVLVHTQMVVDEFLKLWEDPTDEHMYMAALAAMFHDVGKPDAEEVCESAERGVYRRYKGHEHKSAIAWLDFVWGSKEVAERLGLTPMRVLFVAWMIEYHLPYEIRDSVKRQALYETPRAFGALHAFPALLRADARGRISDDHEQKLQRVEEWIAGYESMSPKETVTDVGKRAYVLIGTSSGGKSTVRERIVEEWGKLGVVPNVFNMDSVRLATFPSEGTPLEQYQHAFNGSVEDEDVFQAAVDAEMRRVFQNKNDEVAIVVSDNCNLSKKARNAFIARARQARYTVVAVVLATHPNVARARQNAREDREGVPIWNQFKSLTVPSFYSEMDELKVVSPDGD